MPTSYRDPKVTQTLSAKTHNMASITTRTRAQGEGEGDTVLSRGEVVVDKDKWLGKKGRGKFIKRGSPILQHERRARRGMTAR